MGPLLQAMERTEEGSKDMDHFWESTSKIIGNVDPATGEVVIENYNDFHCGSEVIEAVRRRGHKKG